MTRQHERRPRSRFPANKLRTLRKALCCAHCRDQRAVHVRLRGMSTREALTRKGTDYPQTRARRQSVPGAGPVGEQLAQTARRYRFKPLIRESEAHRSERRPGKHSGRLCPFELLDRLGPAGPNRPRRPAHGRSEFTTQTGRNKKHPACGCLGGRDLWHQTAGLVGRQVCDDCIRQFVAAPDQILGR